MICRKKLKCKNISENSMERHSDSQCVLKWLNQVEHNDRFIHNRVKEIKGYSLEFRYVHTKDNPADIVSRGCKLKDLENNLLWWHGPTWLKRDINNWNKDIIMPIDT